MASVSLDPEVPHAGEAPSMARFKVMGFLCALSFLTYFDRVCIMRAQPEIQRDLSLTDQQMGLILGAFWFAYAVFEIPGGWMGDRVGARFTLTRIVLAWSLFTALSGSAVGFLSLLTFRFLFGVGEAGAYPNMARVQGSWLPLHERARWGGLLWLMARWGGAFSPLLFGTMIRALDSSGFRNFLGTFTGIETAQSVASWRLGFWASGILGLVWCAAFYPWFRDRPRDKKGVNAAEIAMIEAGRDAKTGDDGHKAAPGMWGALVTCPSLWAIACLYIFSSFGWSFFVSWMPRFLNDVHGLNFQKSEVVSILPLFCGGISCFVGGWLCDILVRRTGRKRLVRAMFPVCGCTVAALSMLGISVSTSETQAVVLMCLAAASYDFGQAANWASIVDIGGEFAGTATGFINMVGNMGNSLQPVVGAMIFNHFGWGTLFVVYAGAYIIAASMWLFIDPTKTFYHNKLRLPSDDVPHAV